MCGACGARMCGACGARMCGARMCGARMCGARMCGMCGARMCGMCGARMCGARALLFSVSSSFSWTFSRLLWVTVQLAFAPSAVSRSL